MNKKTTYFIGAILIIFLIYLLLPGSKQETIPAFLEKPTGADLQALPYDVESLVAAQALSNTYMELANLVFDHLSEETLEKIATSLVNYEITQNHLWNNDIGINEPFIFTIHESYSPYLTQTSNTYLQKQLQLIQQRDRSNEITIVSPHPLHTHVSHGETSKKYHFYHENTTDLIELGNKVIFEVSPSLQEKLYLDSPIVNQTIFSMEVSRDEYYYNRQKEEYYALYNIEKNMEILRDVLLAYMSEVEDVEEINHFIKEHTTFSIAFHDKVNSYLPEAQMKTVDAFHLLPLKEENSIHHYLNISTGIYNPFFPFLNASMLQTILDEHLQLTDITVTDESIQITKSIDYNLDYSLYILTHLIEMPNKEGQLSIAFHPTFTQLATLPTEKITFYYSDLSAEEGYKDSELYVLEAGKDFLNLLIKDFNQEQKKQLVEHLVLNEMTINGFPISVDEPLAIYGQSMQLSFSQYVSPLIYENKELYELAKDKLLTMEQMQQVTFDFSYPFHEMMIDTIYEKSYLLFSNNASFLENKSIQLQVGDSLKTSLNLPSNEIDLKTHIYSSYQPLLSNRFIEQRLYNANRAYEYPQYRMLHAAIQYALSINDTEMITEYFHSFTRPDNLRINFQPVEQFSEEYEVTFESLNLYLMFFYKNPIVDFLPFEFIINLDDRYKVDGLFTFDENVKIIPSSNNLNSLSSSLYMSYNYQLDTDFEPFYLYFSEELQEKFNIPVSKIKIK